MQARLMVAVLTIGINYYMQGHDAKWQASYWKVDDDIDDASVFGIGLVASV